MRKFTIQMSRPNEPVKYIKCIRINANGLHELDIINTKNKDDALYYNEKIIDGIIDSISKLIEKEELENPNSDYLQGYKSIKFEKIEETGEYIVFEDFINSDNAMDKYYEKHDGMFLLKLSNGEIVTAELNWYQGRGNNYHFESDDLSREFYADDIKKIAILNGEK